MADLFFNNRAWLRIVGEQEARFLEELWRRAGGSGTPDSTLTEVITSVSSVESSVSEAIAQSQSVKKQMQQQETVIETLLSEIKRLKHRINQLEDAQ